MAEKALDEFCEAAQAAYDFDDLFYQL